MADHNITVEIAKSSPLDGMTSRKTTIQLHQPFVEVLVGGPYTHKGSGHYHEYGHAALRVVGANKDITYDFGRYKKVKRLTGGIYGDGILRVWPNFSDYTAAQNNLGRSTRGLVYYSVLRLIRATHQFYESLYGGCPDISLNLARKNIPPAYAAYWLDDDYDVFHNNCVSKVIDGLTIGRPGAFQIPLDDILLEGGPELDGLSPKSRAGAILGTIATSVPKYGIYLPKDLENVLLRNKEIKPDIVNVYAS